MRRQDEGVSRLEFPEGRSHSFIVKIWLEENTQDAGRETWRGRITHVPSGVKRYVKNMDEIIAFIEHYLHPMDESPEE